MSIQAQNLGRKIVDQAWIVTPPARVPLVTPGRRREALAEQLLWLLSRKTAAPLPGESVSRDQLCRQELPKASTCVQRIPKTNKHKDLRAPRRPRRLRVRRRRPPRLRPRPRPPGSPRPRRLCRPRRPKPAAHHAHHAAPAPAAPVNHGSYSPPPPPAPAQDQQGYYYYYYPVQDEKTTGLFDFKKYDVATIVIVGIVVVGVVLLGLSLFTVTTGRSFEPITMSYDQMYDVAKTVYDALQKEY
nr:serine/arginine repetitive matrix protein 1-like [Penaeus vannamei]